jgi:hypothetical protein
VLDRGAHARRRALGAQRQVLVVELVAPGIHLLLDDVGGLADRAPEELRVLDQRHADVAIAVAREPVLHARLEVEPQLRLFRQDIVHAPHRPDCGHDAALMAIVLRYFAFT